MTNRNCTVVALALLALAATANQTRPQTPPYARTNFPGLPPGAGYLDGTADVARFHNPEGVAVETNGNVYVADTQNHVIRKITPAGAVTTLAGSAGQRGSADGTGAAARFHNPTGVATDAGGNVYVADTSNSTIRKVTPVGVVTTLAGRAGQQGGADGIGSAAQLYYPTGVASDSAGNVYVADNFTIRRITPAGAVTTLATLAGSLGPQGSVGSTNAARLDSPAAVAVDGAGNLYVVDYGSFTIQKIAPTGLLTTLAGSAGQYGSADGTGNAARFCLPRGIAVDSAGNVYVADRDNHMLRKITPAGVVTTLAGSPGQVGSADGTGNAARFNRPIGMAVDAAGNVYVADTSNNTIRKVTPAGVVTTLAGNVAPSR